MRKYDHSVNKRNVDDFYILMEEQETFLQVFGSFFPSFDNNEQQDCHEFLTDLFEGLSEEAFINDFFQIVEKEEMEF